MDYRPLDERLMQFAVHVITLTPTLGYSFAKGHIVKQLVRASTSIGANYEEASGAESPQDFVHKMQLALKEARESCYWLRLLVLLTGNSNENLRVIYQESEGIKAMLIAAVVRLKQRREEKEEN